MKRSLFYSCYVPRYEKDKKEGKELLPYVEQAIKYAKTDGYEGIEILPSGELTGENAVGAQMGRHGGFGGILGVTVIEGYDSHRNHSLYRIFF